MGVVWILLACLVPLALATGQIDNGASTLSVEKHQVKRKYDYHLSLKKPYFLFNKSQTLEILTLTSLEVHALASDEYIRLTSTVPGMHGGVWAKSPNPHHSWQERNQDGPVYGSIDKWTGLGLFFDTAEVNENRFTPYLFAILNDGNIQSTTVMTRFFMPNAQKPVFGRLTYANRTLRVSLLKQNLIRKWIYPLAITFGFSAGTSDHSADDHDLVSLETYELDPAPKRGYVKATMAYSKLWQKPGNEYKIDEEIKERIRDSEQIVSKFQEESQSDYAEPAVNNVNPQIIVESIDILLQKLDPEGAVKLANDQSHHSIHNAVKPVDEKINELNTRLEDLGQKVFYISRSIETLYSIIRDSHTRGGQTLQEVAKKLEASNIQGASWTFFSVFFLLGGIIVYMASVFLRMRQKSHQKYF
ncbi:concanavalin A-like lectin/glucanase domain-containing protein [Chytridium lagenaria]|nr:concanavalin A-like lectin/glucanase domain-containing protein [Chytridium lagenaria]